jgi:hypothetical protein
MKKQIEGILKARLINLPDKIAEFIVTINGTSIINRTINNNVVEVPCEFIFGENIIDVEFLNKDPNDTKVVDGQVTEDLAIQMEELIVDGVDISHQFKVNSHYRDNPSETTYGFMYKNGALTFKFVCPVFLYIRNLALIKD